MHFSFSNIDTTGLPSNHMCVFSDACIIFFAPVTLILTQ